MLLVPIRRKLVSLVGIRRWWTLSTNLNYSFGAEKALNDNLATVTQYTEVNGYADI